MVNSRVDNNPTFHPVTEGPGHHLWNPSGIWDQTRFQVFENPVSLGPHNGWWFNIRKGGRLCNSIIQGVPINVILGKTLPVRNPE